jgi:hypothetical protein
MALKDILLRTQTHPVLSTKGDILEMEELDDNIIEIYEAIRNRRTIETEADGGIMSLVGDFNLFKINATDGVDVQTVVFDATTYRKIMLFNDSGTDIKFTTDDNIRSPFNIPDGVIVECFIGDDEMTPLTAVQTRGLTMAITSFDNTGNGALATNATGEILTSYTGMGIIDVEVLCLADWGSGLEYSKANFAGGAAVCVLLTETTADTFSASDTADRVCVFWDTSGVDPVLKIKNRLAGAAIYLFKCLSATGAI